jgi:hypothetical protein
MEVVLIKVIVTIKHPKIELLPMFTVEDEVNYQSVKDTLTNNIAVLKSILMVAKNAV